MYRFISSVVLIAGAVSAPLGAQQVEPLDPQQAEPQVQLVQLAPPEPGTPQIFEFHNGGLLTGGTYLGVNLCEVPSDPARELKLKGAYGVQLPRVEDASPAEKAGLKSGDVVLEYNGQRVKGMEQFGRLVRETPPAREVKLTIGRNGSTQTLTAVLGSRKSRYSGNFPSNFVMPEF